MRINHNIAALNTYSRLNQANFKQSQSLEKLSSGLRINKAGDDAAGLAISEKMRSQIRGLGQATRNAQDGISMIQTAEGALNETQSILQRMRELSVQASSDTNTDQERSEIQKEVNQLSSEINRIAGSTEFNKQTLLDGGAATGNITGVSGSITNQGTDTVQAVYVYCFSTAVGAVGGTDTICMCGAALTACTLACTSVAGSIRELATLINNSCTGWEAEAVGGKLTISAVVDCAHDGSTGNCTSILSFSCTSICYSMDQTTDGAVACAQVQQITFTDDGIREGVVIAAGNCAVGFYNSASGTYANTQDVKNQLGVDTVIDILCSDGSTICAKDMVTLLVGCGDANDGTFDCFTACKVGDYTLKLTNVATGTEVAAENKVTITAGTGTAASEGNGIALQIGANGNQKLNISFEDMTGSGISVTSMSSGEAITTSDGKTAYFSSTLGVADLYGTTNEYALDVTTSEKANSAISAIDDAIQAVSSERSKYGAYQNRLEHTIANLENAYENITAAESRIRDVDMAREMMEFTKNNILNQAATSMLSQANQQPQGVLSLLR